MKNNPLDFLHLKSLYLLLLCFSLYWNDSYGSFYFKDFNETAGLVVSHPHPRLVCFEMIL